MLIICLIAFTFQQKSIDEQQQLIDSEFNNDYDDIISADSDSPSEQHYYELNQVEAEVEYQPSSVDETAADDEIIEVDEPEGPLK